jgi:hypothetical protein
MITSFEDLCLWTWWSEQADAALSASFEHVALFIDEAKVACSMWGCVTCFWC